MDKIQYKVELDGAALSKIVKKYYQELSPEVQVEAVFAGFGCDGKALKREHANRLSFCLTLEVKPIKDEEEYNYLIPSPVAEPEPMPAPSRTRKASNGNGNGNSSKGGDE